EPAARPHRAGGDDRPPAPARRPHPDGGPVLRAGHRREAEPPRGSGATGQRAPRPMRFREYPPLVFTALRACTTLAMIGAVVSEFFGGPVKSLGVYIKRLAMPWRAERGDA